LAYMLDEAGRRAATAQLRSDLQDQLARSNARDPATLPALEKWCADAWGASNNPNLRYLIRELLHFVRAYSRCGTAMCGQPTPYPVPAEQARAGLNLPLPPNIQAMTFADLPAPPDRLSMPPAPDGLRADTIRATFPLIRRVRVDVKLSKHIWDFSALA